MALRAVIERWSAENILYVCELPGCIVSARSLDTALAAAPDAIRAYVRWARAHVIILPPLNGTELTVVEEGTPAPRGIGPFFSTDNGTLNQTEFDLAVQVCHAALSDLIALYQEADERQQMFKRSDSEWSAFEIMQHVAAMDLWYSTRTLSRYVEEPAYTLPRDAIDAVKFAAECADFTLRDVFEHRRGAKFERDDEEWSLLKLIRRRAGHLREHYPQLLLAVRQRML
jgi:predicted RNase H-like HicB family nuclease